MIVQMEGRDIEIEVSGDNSDDIEIVSAYYLDTEEDVSDQVIDLIYSMYGSDLYEEWFEQQLGRAESYYEGDR